MQPSLQRVRFGKILPLALLGVTLLGTPAGRAEAATAIGPYLDAANGTGTFEWDSDNFDFDVDSGSGAVGFVLDTAPAGAANFNYRLNIGLEGQNLEDENGATLEMGGVSFENIFGFALVRQRDFRWWAGPLVRIGFYSGETDDQYNSYGDRYKTEADLFEFGVGFATGINFRIGPHAYLAPSAGVRYIGAGGEGTVKNFDLHTQEEDDLSGHLTSVFVNLSLLFD